MPEGKQHNPPKPKPKQPKSTQAPKPKPPKITWTRPKYDKW